MTPDILGANRAGGSQPFHECQEKVRVKTLSGVQLMKGGYPRDIATLTMGSVVGQGIAMATYPLATRLYLPEELGGLAIVLSLVGIIAPVVNGHYDLCVVSVPGEAEAVTIAVGSVAVGVGVTAAFALLLTMCRLCWPGLFGAAGMLVFFAVPLLMIAVLVNPLSAYNNRNCQYRLLALVYAVRPAAQAVGQLLFGFVHLGVLGLAIAQTIGALLGINCQARFALSRKAEFRGVRPGEVVRALKAHHQQPVYSASALLAGTAAYALLTIVINSLYGLRELGLYSLSVNILGIPISVVTANISNVFFQRASAEKRARGNFVRAFRSTAVLLLLIAVPLFLGTLLIPNWTYRAVFGAGWERAGVFVSLLAPAFATRLVSSALIHSLIVGNRQKLKFATQTMLLVEVMAASFIARRFALPIESFLQLVCIAFSVTYIWLFVIALRTSLEDSSATLSGAPLSHS